MSTPMKSSLAVIFLLLFCGAALGAEVLNKKAVLILPDYVECESGSGVSLPAEISFRWDEEEPLRFSIWRLGKTENEESVLCSLAIYDEKGRELSYAAYMSLPPAPSDEGLLRKGMVKRIKAFSSGGYYIFPGAGNYYAIGTFPFAWAGNANVIFTTSRRWFKVIEAPPKPKKT